MWYYGNLSFQCHRFSFVDTVSINPDFEIDAIVELQWTLTYVD
jgi:hypothetical protein